MFTDVVGKASCFSWTWRKHCGSCVASGEAKELSDAGIQVDHAAWPCSKRLNPVVHLDLVCCAAADRRSETPRADMLRAWLGTGRCCTCSDPGLPDTCCHASFRWMESLPGMLINPAVYNTTCYSTVQHGTV